MMKMDDDKRIKIQRKPNIPIDFSKVRKIYGGE